jgi:uncharacterized protein YjdB
VTYRACLLCLALGSMAPTAATAQRCRVADVAVAPSNPQIRPGDSLSVFATGYDAKGMPCAMAVFTWSSSNVQIARVDQNGRVRGVSAGVAIITARTGTGRVAKSGRTVVTVATATVHVAEVTVNPRDAQVQVGGRTPFVATAYDRANNPIASAVFVWLSSNPAVATIDQNGIASGVTPGVTRITVRVGTAPQAKTAQARLQVSPAFHNAPRPAPTRPR